MHVLPGISWFCECIVFILIAIASTEAIFDDTGGTAPDALVCAGSLSKKRRTVQAVRDLAMLPGPDYLWPSGW